VVDGVQSVVGPFAEFAVSESGALAYLAGGEQRIPMSTFVWVDRAGAEQPLPAAPGFYGAPGLAPGGGRFAVTIAEGNSLDLRRDLWIYDLSRGALTRLTFDRACYAPVWTPDGTRVFHGFGLNAQQGFKVRAVPSDGSAPPTALADVVFGTIPTSLSADGNVLLGVRVQQGPSPYRGGDLWALRVSETSPKPQPFMDTQAGGKANPQFAPNGRLVAYQSDESGRNEIYVTAYPGPGGKWQVSIDGGAEPRWNPSGRELFYRSGNKLMAVPVETSPTFRAGAPKMLFEGRYEPTYDVAPDGTRFLMLKSTAVPEPSQIHVVVNWIEELKTRLATGK
jgi:hypothetical protein